MPELIRSGEGVGVRMRQLGEPQSSGWGEQGAEAEKGTVYRLPALRVWEQVPKGLMQSGEWVSPLFSQRLLGD